MIYYNVTIKLLAEIESEWLEWMRTEHIPEVLATGQFNHARMFRLLEPQDEEGITYTVQYQTDTITQYNNYIDRYSMALREKGLNKFENKFIAFRALLEEVSTS